MFSQWHVISFFLLSFLTFWPSLYMPFCLKIPKSVVEVTQWAFESGFS